MGSGWNGLVPCTSQSCGSNKRVYTGELHGSLGSSGLRPMPPHYSRDLEHEPGGRPGLLSRLPPPASSRPVSGVGLGPLVCRIFTAVSRPLLYTVFRSAICDCLSMNGCFYPGYGPGPGLRSGQAISPPTLPDCAAVSQGVCLGISHPLHIFASDTTLDSGDYRVSLSQWAASASARHDQCRQVH
jgi:hypothetical protein